MARFRDIANLASFAEEKRSADQLSAAALIAASEHEFGLTIKDLLVAAYVDIERNIRIPLHPDRVDQLASFVAWLSDLVAGTPDSIDNIIDPVTRTRSSGTSRGRGFRLLDLLYGYRPLSVDCFKSPEAILARQVAGEASRRADRDLLREESEEIRSDIMQFVLWVRDQINDAI